MEGAGTSRIDIVQSNPSAVVAIVGFTPRWALVQVDHVPLQVHLKMGRFQMEGAIQNGGALVKVDGVLEHYDAAWHDAAEISDELHGARFNRAIQEHDKNQAHVTWNLLAEVAI